MSSFVRCAGVCLVMAASPAYALDDATWTGFDATAGRLLQESAPVWRDEGPTGRRTSRLGHLLDEAVRRLATGESVTARARYAELGARQEAATARLSELRARLGLLPRDSCDASGRDAAWLVRQASCLFATSRADQARLIADAEGELTRIDAERRDARDRFVAGLAGIGVILPPDRAEALLELATADDVVAAHAVYGNLRAIDSILRTATVEAGESIAAARRYHGLHAVLLDVAVHVHERFLDQVRDEHLPRLGALEEEARNARADAAALRRRAVEPELASQLDANLRALDLTLHAAALYRRVLEGQTRAVEAAGQRVARHRDVAVNTWRAVEASADLLKVLNTARPAADLVLTLDIPLPQPFENRELEREFERLSARLVADR